MNKDLELFINELIDEKALENLNDETLKQIKEDLYGRLEDRINATMVANMPPEKLSEFEKLVDAGNEDEIQKFCQENISDLNQIIAKELLEFRATYLNI